MSNANKSTLRVSNTSLEIEIEIEIGSMLDFYQTGHLDLAEKLAKVIIEKHPDHQFSWKLLGVVFYQTGRLQESLIANQRAIEISPNDPELHNNIGNTLKQLGKMEEATKSYRAATAINPKYAEAHSNLGVALQEFGLLEEAEVSLNKAIRIKPEYAEAHSNLGIALQELGRLEEAALSYERAIAAKPDLVQAHSNLALLLMQIGDMVGSGVIHRRAMQFNTKIWSTYFAYSTYLYEVGEFELALEIIKSAHSIAPEDRKKVCDLALKAITLKNSNADNKNEFNSALKISSSPRLGSDHQILFRPVEDDLIAQLYQINSKALDSTADARYGNGICSVDFDLFNDTSKVIKSVAQDLTKICQQTVNSNIFIDDSFFNIYSAGSGSKQHCHIKHHDKYFDLSHRKHSLVYYLDVGDQHGLEPGVLKLCDPAADILPRNGMICIINATRPHCAVYDGKEDRVMIGVNFYSI